MPPTPPPPPPIPRPAGLISPGGTVVEGTAGNTGIGLAHMCNALGVQVRHIHAKYTVSSKTVRIIFSACIAITIVNRIQRMIQFNVRN
jgi:cysteine synthase